MNKALFITFEGSEGCGKTTQSKLLAKFLTDNNIASIHTREPGGTDMAETIRNILLNPQTASWHKNTEVLLHMAARSEHLTKLIKPALACNKWVICDRFIDSTIAYQGYGHQLGTEYIMSLHNMAFESFMPDLTFIFDLDLKESFNRVKQRYAQLDYYEQMSLAFHQRVRDGFLAIAKDTKRCVLIDASRSIEEIHLELVEIVKLRGGF